MSRLILMLELGAVSRAARALQELCPASSPREEAAQPPRNHPRWIPAGMQAVPALPSLGPWALCQ